MFCTSRNCLQAFQTLQQANARGSLLVTADKDFGELVFRQGRIHSRVVLLRLAGLSNSMKADSWPRSAETGHANYSRRSASSRLGGFAYGARRDGEAIGGGCAG